MRRVFTFLLVSLCLAAQIAPTVSHAQDSAKLTQSIAITSSTNVKFPRISSDNTNVFIGGSYNSKASLWNKTVAAEGFSGPTTLGTASTGGKAADYANSSAAVGADGTVYEVWIAQSSGIFMRARYPDGTLGTQHTITTGSAFRAFVDIGVTSNNTIIVTWDGEESGDPRHFVTYSTNGGESWTGRQTLIDAKAYRSKAWIATGPNNSAVITYFTYPDFNLYASIWDGGGFNREKVSSGSGSYQPADPSAAISGTGAMYVAWRTVSGEAYYAQRNSANNWGRSRLAGGGGTKGVIGTVGIDADENNNLHVSWISDKSGSPKVYYAFRSATNGWSSLYDTASGGTYAANAAVAGSLSDSAYGHVVYERFSGDSMYNRYLRFSNTNGGNPPSSEPNADPVINNGATSTNSSNVTLTFANVTNSPTQVRWKWNGFPSDSSTDSNGWQTYADSMQVALPSNVTSCQNLILYAQVRNNSAIDSSINGASVTFDNTVQASANITNPHYESKPSTISTGVEGGAVNFTRESTIKVSLSDSGDCMGIKSFSVGNGTEETWTSGTTSINRNVDVDTSSTGQKSIAAMIKDNLNNTANYNLSYYYDPYAAGTGAPQYTSGSFTVSDENTLIRTLNFSGVNVTDTIYQQATGKSFWGIWVAVSTQLLDSENAINTSNLQWQPIFIDTPSNSFSSSISLASGQGASTPDGTAPGTYYIYVKFLDGAGNASTKTLISDRVTLVRGYAYPKSSLPLIAK